MKLLWLTVHIIKPKSYAICTVVDHIILHSHSFHSPSTKYKMCYIWLQLIVNTLILLGGLLMFQGCIIWKMNEIYWYHSYYDCIYKLKKKKRKYKEQLLNKADSPCNHTVPDTTEYKTQSYTQTHTHKNYSGVNRYLTPSNQKYFFTHHLCLNNTFTPQHCVVLSQKTSSLCQGNLSAPSIALKKQKKTHFKFYCIVFQNHRNKSLLEYTTFCTY